NEAPVVRIRGPDAGPGLRGRRYRPRPGRRPTDPPVRRDGNLPGERPNLDPIQIGRRELAGVPGPDVPMDRASSESIPDSSDDPRRERQACLWIHQLEAGTGSDGPVVRDRGRGFASPGGVHRIPRPGPEYQVRFQPDPASIDGWVWSLNP